MHDNTIAIAVLFYNKVQQTIDCIESFLPSGVHLYVLNNGSDARQWRRLQEQYRGNEKVVLLDACHNLGVSGGRNFLIRHTNEPWLLFVDNDIRCKQPASWLADFHHFRAANPEATIICPHLFNIHEQGYALQLQLSIDEDRVAIKTGHFPLTNCFPGGASFVHRSVFETYGLYDESMFVGFEDYEYALRAVMSGKGEFQVFACGEIELIHDHQLQRSQSDKEAVRKRYDGGRLKQSYDHLVSKYNIVFEHHWEWWCRKQVEEMTGKGNFQKLKNKLKTMLNR